MLTRQEHYLSGARLLSAVQATHRQGGGEALWGWMADSEFLFGRAGANSRRANDINIDPDDWNATTNGGPYCHLDGAAEYFDGGDNTEFEFGAYNALIWHWCNPDTLPGADMIIVSKWGNGATHRQYRLKWDTGAGAFQFEVSTDGTAISTVTSTYVEAATEWYFVAGYFTPSDAAGLRIYVGEATDDVLTTDTALSPAQIYTLGTSAFEIGAENVGNELWDGKIGIGAGRREVTPGAGFADIDGYAARLFAETKLKYR